MKKTGSNEGGGRSFRAPEEGAPPESEDHPTAENEDLSGWRYRSALRACEGLEDSVTAAKRGPAGAARRAGFRGGLARRKPSEGDFFTSSESEIGIAMPGWALGASGPMEIPALPPSPTGFAKLTTMGLRRAHSRAARGMDTIPRPSVGSGNVLPVNGLRRFGPRGRRATSRAFARLIPQTLQPPDM